MSLKEIIRNIVLLLLVPSVPPIVVKLQNFSSSGLNITFRPLNDSDREGVLIGYTAFFQLVEEYESCSMTGECSQMNSTLCQGHDIVFCEMSGLELNRNYTVKLAATTSAGNGPFSEFWYAETDTFGNFFTFSTAIL